MVSVGLSEFGTTRDVAYTKRIYPAMTELAAAMNSFERKIRFKYLSPLPQKCFAAIPDEHCG
jgi:hypothetical protein